MRRLARKAGIKSAGQLSPHSLKQTFATASRGCPSSLPAPTTYWPRFADAYVSAAHRDDPATGCAVVALGTDMPRVGGQAQEAYGAQVERYLAHLQPLLGDDSDDDDARRRATVLLSAMVGAVMIARALVPTPDSDEILHDVREAVRERRLA